MCVIATHHLGRQLVGEGAVFYTHTHTCDTTGLSLWTDGFRLLPFRITKMSLGFCLFDSCLPPRSPFAICHLLHSPENAPFSHFFVMSEVGCDLFGSHLHILLSANVDGSVCSCEGQMCGMRLSISSVPFTQAHFGIIYYRIRSGRVS